MLRMLSSLAAGLLLGLLGPLAASAPAAYADDVDDFSFVSFDADYYLTRADDGSSRLRTVETLVARFPDRDQNRGIVRAIPLRYDGADLDTAVLSVTDADGDAVPYSEDQQDGFLEIGTGTDDFVRGDQTYVIEYEQVNVTRSYDDTAADEFYWDTNGTGWDQPFGEVTARVHVPADLAAALTGSSACYGGAQGEQGDCVLSRDEDGEDAGAVFSASASDLGPGENLTVAIGFDRGTFTEPARIRDQPWIPVLPGVVAGLGVLLAGLAALLRRTRWRDASGRGIVVAQYERPAGVDLLEAGELVGRSGSAMSAQLMDLAVRGHLRVIERPYDPGDRPKYSLEFVSVDGLTAPERAVVTAVFGDDLTPGERRKLGASEEIGRQLEAQATQAKSRVIGKRWMRTVSRGSTGLVATAGVALGILAIVVFAFLVGVDALTWLATGVLLASVGLGALAIVFAAKASRITDAGADIRDHLLGVKDYIRLAEADRLRMLQSPAGAERRAGDRAGGPRRPGAEASDPERVVRVYEKLLPFAVLFGLEKEWSHELERLYSTTGHAPGWYSGTEPFDSGAFRGTVVATQAHAAASSWSGSAGGSGFGGSMGGGFSGGGGGGGGGGGR